MNAREHFAEAERQLKVAELHNTEHPGDMRIAEITAMTAQVHATLALAASQMRSLPAEQDPEDQGSTAAATKN